MTAAARIRHPSAWRATLVLRETADHSDPDPHSTRCDTRLEHFAVRPVSAPPGRGIRCTCTIFNKPPVALCGWPGRVTGTGRGSRMYSMTDSYRACASLTDVARHARKPYRFCPKRPSFSRLTMTRRSNLRCGNRPPTGTRSATVMGNLRRAPADDGDRSR